MPIYMNIFFCFMSIINLRRLAYRWEYLYYKYSLTHLSFFVFFHLFKSAIIKFLCPEMFLSFLVNTTSRLFSYGRSVQFSLLFIKVTPPLYFFSVMRSHRFWFCWADLYSFISSRILACFLSSFSRYIVNF
jgi:hypothetical protein